MLHPIQLPYGKRGRIAAEVTERAYEVYAYLYGGAQTLERLNERGGFHISELLTLLYLRTFPKNEWRLRDRTCGKGMDLHGNGQ